MTLLAPCLPAERATYIFGDSQRPDGLKRTVSCGPDRVVAIKHADFGAVFTSTGKPCNQASFGKLTAFEPTIPCMRNHSASIAAPEVNNRYHLLGGGNFVVL